MFQQQQYQAAAAAAAAAGLPMPAMPPSMMQGMGMPAVPAVPEGVDPEEYAAYLHAQHQAAISAAEAAEERQMPRGREIGEGRPVEEEDDTEGGGGQDTTHIALHRSLAHRLATTQ